MPVGAELQLRLGACDGGDDVMTFKDDLKADLRAVFFNSQEFASFHNINGIILLVTERQYTEQMTGRLSDQYTELHGEHLVIQFRAEDLLRKSSRLPHERERLKYDGKMYTVEHAENEFGGCRYTLSSYRGVRG